MEYGICDCGKWGEAPKHFKEYKHFMKCPVCTRPMYLDRENPIRAGYPESNKVVITETFNHGGG